MTSASKPRSKGSPLAVGDDFGLVLRKCFEPGLLVSVLIAAVLYGLIRDAHAETNAEKVFGAWVRVTPETILQPVPDWHFQNTGLGAVTNEYKKDRPAQPGGPHYPSVSRPSAPEQAAGLKPTS